MILQSATVYDGPSCIDGAPVVATVTGLGRPSRNAKTGCMAQSYILPRDVSPIVAQRTGADVSVCGNCRLRPLLARRTGGARCYVCTLRGPQGAWRAAQGRAVADPGMLSRPLRLGAYGDPGALPLETVLALRDRARAGWTGYTSQWRWRPDLKSTCMASVQTPTELATAEAQGWRCFYAVTGERPLWGLWAKRRMRQCPNASHGIQCADCLLCNGGDRGPHVWIDAH